jgi:hypothetical protein
MNYKVMKNARFLVICGDWNINQKVKFVVVNQFIKYGCMSNKSCNKVKLSN